PGRPQDASVVQSPQRRSDKGKPGESRGHKATGPRLLRDAAVGDATRDPRPPSYRTGWLGGWFFFGGKRFRAEGGSSDEEPQWQADEPGRLPSRTDAGAEHPVRRRRRRAPAGAAAAGELDWRHHSLPDDRRARRAHHARLPDGAGIG